MNNAKGALMLVSGIYIQQYCEFHKFRHGYLIALISILLEVLSLYELPLSTYILLGSLSLVFRSFQEESQNLARPFNLQHKGNILMISGCLVSLLFGGHQQDLNDFSELHSIYRPFYLSWMVFTLVLNISMRACGYYKGNIFIETSIPSQLSSFAYASLKLVCLILNLYFQNKETNFHLAILCLLITIFSFGLSSSFLKYFGSSHQSQLVHAGNYFWLVCYGFPLGITLVHHGTNLTLEHYYALTIGCTLILIGSYLHTFEVLPDKKFDEKEGKKLIRV